MHDSVHAKLLWENSPDQKETKNPVACYSLAVSPDGSRLVCGVGEKILVFDSRTGARLHSLKGHKHNVYCVAWSTDGEIVASGGADKTVVLWTSKFEGIVKYSHNESVQCLAFNPQTHELISGATTDFGVWKQNQKVVSKNSVSSKLLTLAWTEDGNHLALGHFDGSVSIRDRFLLEKAVIQKSAPVWSLAWSHQKDSAFVLNVGTWASTISSHSLAGETISETFLEAVPCALVFDTSTGCFLTGGTDRKVRLLKNDGKIQVELFETEEWVWSIQSFTVNNQNYIAASTNEGTVSVYELKIKALFDISGEWCVQREQVNTITINNLDYKKLTQVSFKNLVESVAIYKTVIAVQLSAEVCLCTVNKELRCNILSKLQIPESWRLRMVSSCHVHFSEFYCSTGQWSKLHSWIEPTSIFWKEVQMAYAEWMLNKNDLDGAVKAFMACKATDRVIPLLKQQIQTHLSIEEFAEVSRFYMKLAQLALSVKNESTEFQKYMKLSELYYVYNLINSSVHCPFNTTHITTLFNAAHFLSTQLHSLQEASYPKGIRLSYVLYVLFKSARVLGAHALAKKSCERLLTLQLPSDWREEILLELLRLQAENCPVDISDILPTCPRCGETNKSLSVEEDSCSYCGTPFVRCFVTFDRLPVVEFFLKKGISMSDALRSIDSDPPADEISRSKQDSAPNVWRLDDSDEEVSFDDPFSSLTAHLGSNLIFDLSALRKIPRREILVLTITTKETQEGDDEAPVKNARFFKVMDESVMLFADECGHLYLHEEYRQMYLETGQNPFTV